MSYPRWKSIAPIGSQRCAHTIERRGKGMRYVYSRTRCRRLVKDQGRPYEYCWQHQAEHYVRIA